MRPRQVALCLVALVVLVRLIAVGPASALGMLWPALLLLVAAAIGRARFHRTLSVGVAGLLLLFAVEAAVHSAHHGSDGESAQCTVASVAGQTGGVSIEAAIVPKPASAVPRVVADEPVGVAIRQLRPGQGRAPPVTA